MEMGVIVEILKTLVDANSGRISNNSPRQIITKHTEKVVQRKPKPLWQQRYWRKYGNEYNGFYRTKFGSWQGKIIESYGYISRFYIFNPPSCIKNHSHYRCFILKGRGKYEIHFSEPAKTIDAGIIEIEKILSEAHRIR